MPKPTKGQLGKKMRVLCWSIFLLFHGEPHEIGEVGTGSFKSLKVDRS